MQREYNTKPNKTSFKKGHIAIKGAFGKGSSHSIKSKKKIGETLTGLIGSNARRWKGEKAGYVAKHSWITKHYGKASKCENNINHFSTRYHWANISGEYKRGREDYRELCPSCNVKESKKDYCKNGHPFSKENTYIRPEG